LAWIKRDPHTLVVVVVVVVAGWLAINADVDFHTPLNPCVPANAVEFARGG